MSAAILNLLVEQGAAFGRTLSLSTVAGGAFDLTGYEASGRIKIAKGQYCDFTCAVASPSTGGQLTVSLTAAQTAALPCLPPYYIGPYTIKISKADTGDAVRLLKGDAFIDPDV